MILVLRNIYLFVVISVFINISVSVYILFSFIYLFGRIVEGKKGILFFILYFKIVKRIRNVCFI